MILTLVKSWRYFAILFTSVMGLVNPIFAQSSVSVDKPAANEVLTEDEAQNVVNFNAIDQDAVMAEDSLILQNQLEQDENRAAIEGFNVPIAEPLGRANIFAGAPPIPGSLRDLAKEEAPEEYRVEIGDTLFDICDQLIDEPNYWPRLWALNPYIRNPHFIYPGMTLSFFSGDTQNPPFLQVVTEDDVMPVDTKDIDPAEMLKQDISSLLTRSERVGRTPVLSADEIKPFPEIDEAFVTEGGVFSSSQLTVIMPAFIVEEEFEPLATVVGGSSGSLLADTGQAIILEVEDEETPLTESLTIVRETGEVDDPVTDDFVGYRYEFVGHIQGIKDTVEDDIKLAQVLFSRLGVMPGDLVVPFTPVKRTVPIGVVGRDSPGLNVAGFNYPNARIGGKGNFVVLAKTEDASVASGDTVNIYRNTKDVATSFLKSDLPDVFVKAGEAYIVDSNEKTAIGYIVSDLFEIRIGNVTNPSQATEE